MRRTWKLLLVVAITAALGLYLIPAGPAAPLPALAGDCTQGNMGTLIVDIVDVSTGSPVNEAGAQVLIKPDPHDFVLDDIVVDTALGDASATQDQDSSTGVIRYENACSTQGSETYSISLWGLPEELAACKIKTDSATTQLGAGDTEKVTLEVDCTGVGPTPTVTVTPTPGPAATVFTSTSPLAVSCNGTSVISVQVRDATGKPVHTGTAVTITTNLGSVSPSSGFVTGSNGAVFAFYTAPANTGGIATITAAAGTISGSATVNVVCGSGSTSTVAPPPTVTGGSIIQPPNTGGAGLANAGEGRSLSFIAGLLSLAGLGVVVMIALSRKSRT